MHRPDTDTELRERLKKLGLRATSTRLAVLHTLHDAAGPLTHEQVMDSPTTRSLDRATVYRILADLSEAGILRRMDLGDHVWRFEFLDGCRSISDDHAHFLCEACQQVTCLPPLEVRAVSGALPQVLRGAEIRLEVRGRCAECTHSAPAS